MSTPRPIRAARLMGRLPLFALALAAATAATSLRGQYELESEVSNNLSQRAGGIPVGPGGTPSGEPTITPQFSNVVETSGTAGVPSPRQ